MKVLTFSRQFPGYHPKAGQPTFFVEKIISGNFTVGSSNEKHYPEKFHTIRAGSRWQVGEEFSARIWTGPPYRSKQEAFAILQIKKLWSISLSIIEDKTTMWVDNRRYKDIAGVAKNDGLLLQDMLDWFKVHPKKKKEVFTGQIICWNENINY